MAGTTRDPVDTLITRDDKSYLLIDTAGIRRRSQVSGAPEELAVMMARRQIERAQVAMLVIDAAAGVTSGDLAIAGTIWELGGPRWWRSTSGTCWTTRRARSWSSPCSGSTS